MKSTFLFTAAAILLAGHAHALPTPDPMTPLKDCMTWAGSIDPQSAPHARARCYALHTCANNHSDDRESLVECTNAAEVAFAESIGKLENLGDLPTTNVESSVTTEKAASLYDRKGEGKGWENADLGN